MRIFGSAPLRLFNIGIAGALGIIYSASVAAAAHRESPLIKFDQSVQTNDIYIYQDVEGNEALAVIAQAQARGNLPDSIVISAYRGDEHSHFFSEDNPISNPVSVISQAEPGLIPVRPQVVLNGNGIGLAAIYNDFDPFAPPPFTPPKGELVLVNPGPVSEIGQSTVWGTRAVPRVDFEIDLVLDIGMSVDLTLDDNFFASRLGVTVTGGVVKVLEKYNEDGTIDREFNAPPSPVPIADLPFEPAEAIKGLADGGVARVRTTRQGVILERYDATGNPLGGPLNVNQSPIDNANVVAIDAAPDATVNIVHQQADPNDFTPQAILSRVADGEIQRASLGIAGLINPINPDVAVNKDGNTFVTYHAETSGPNASFDRGDVYVQIFNPFGLAIGGPRRVNTNTAGTQNDASIDDAKDGGVVVAFTTNVTDSGNQEIHGIKLDAPLKTNKNTIVANDFGTPTTPLRNAGFSATSNGLPIIGNQVFITADPLNPDSTDGVLGFDIADPEDGTLLATYNDNLLFSSFPNGRRSESDFLGIGIDASYYRLIENVVTDFVVDLTAVDAATKEQYFKVSTRQHIDPGESLVGVDEANPGNPAPAVLAQWIDLNFTAALSAEQSALLATENIVFAYSIGIEANAPTLVYIDDLKIDLIPTAVPLPAPALLLFSACACLFAKRKAAED